MYMNYVQLIGRIVNETHPYNGFAYKVRVRRSGAKEVYDDIDIVLPEKHALVIDALYDFSGVLGVRAQKRAKEEVDICVYVTDIYNIEQDEQSFSGVYISGTITAISKDPKIPNKISLLLKADDGSHDKYKVVAWNRRRSYIENKQVGDHLNVCGELVKYFYRSGSEFFYHVEIAFWYESQPPEE